MGYASEDGAFWTVNRQPDGTYKVVKRKRGKGGGVVSEDRTYESARAPDAAARAAQLAYEQGTQDGRNRIKKVVEEALDT